MKLMNLQKKEIKMNQQKLRIKTFGAIGNTLCQLPRINEALLKNDFIEFAEENPDLIYVNDAGFHTEGIELKKKYPASKLILNVLDIPFHCKEIQDIVNNLGNNFHYADAITTISESVKKQMLYIFPGLQVKGLSVIYQPIKPVFPLDIERTSNLLFVGRANDSNKRFNLAMEIAALSARILDVVGPEDPTNSVKYNYRKFINYMGLLEDEALNKEYNSHAATIISSKNEGLCLPLIESLCCKTPVVCCESMTTASELCPPEFISKESLFDLYEKLVFVTNGSKKVLDRLNECSEAYLQRFSPQQIANNIINTYGKITK
jgi:glycosyltransferase involved in cell wall biosynthesis